MNIAVSQIINLRLELDSLMRCTEQVAQHLNSGSAATSDVEKIVCWTNKAAHLFNRQASALARLRKDLALAANLPA